MKRMEYHVAIEYPSDLRAAHDPDVTPKLSGEQVRQAVKGALITHLGYHVTHSALESGDLKIVVS